MIKIFQNEIIDEARSWIGTPYHHQASLKGIGADCGGFVRGVYRNVGFDVPNVPVGYSRTPSNGNLERVIARYLSEVRLPMVGDVITFKFITEPHHMAIFLGDTIIHSHVPAGKVVEHRFDERWKFRVAKYWHYAGLVS